MAPFFGATVKNLFENSANGFRIASGVTGKGTGYRADCIVDAEETLVRTLEGGQTP